MTLPTVRVVSLGGTIAMAGGQGGVVPTLNAADLVTAVPQLAETARIEAVSFLQMPGAHLGFRDMANLASFITAQEGVDGVVVTQGTDTIEETSFALDMLLSVDFPVVVTGAMRNPTLPGADGPANLVSATMVAASAKFRGTGVTVVMNDEVHAARFVQKGHSTNPAAFTSLPYGPVGFISEDVVSASVRPAPLPKWGGVEGAADFPKVALLATGIGDDGTLIRAAADLGYDAVVLEASGGGHVAPAVAEAVSQVAKHVPVVVATRTRKGATLTSTYGFTGSEIDLRKRGAIFTGPIDAIKARIALTLLLAGNADRARIESWFEACL